VARGKINSVVEVRSRGRSTNQGVLVWVGFEKKVKAKGENLAEAVILRRGRWPKDTSKRVKSGGRRVLRAQTLMSLSQDPNSPSEAAEGGNSI